VIVLTQANAIAVSGRGDSLLHRHAHSANERTLVLVVVSQGGLHLSLCHGTALLSLLNGLGGVTRRHGARLAGVPEGGGVLVRFIFATNCLSAIGVKQTSAVARDDRGERSMPKMTDSRRKKIQARQRRSRAELRRKKKAAKRAQRSAKA
jgi:hypothetical protein